MQWRSIGQPAASILSIYFIGYVNMEILQMGHGIFSVAFLQTGGKLFQVKLFSVLASYRSPASFGGVYIKV